MKFGDDLEKENLYNQWHLNQPGFKDAGIALDPWYETVLKILPEDFKGKLLELGCGSGNFSILIAEKYPEAIIIGTDFSHTAINAAKKKIPAQLSNISFQVENAEKLSFTTSGFDMVISCETMEHVFDPQKMACEIYRILKPGCKCILTTENYFNGLILSWLQSRILKRPFDSGSGVQPHENFMLFYRTKRFFIKAGFKRIMTQSNHYQWLLLPGVNPDALRTNNFDNKFLRFLFKPFGRHYTYEAIKPLADNL